MGRLGRISVASEAQGNPRNLRLERLDLAALSGICWDKDGILIGPSVWSIASVWCANTCFASFGVF